MDRVELQALRTDPTASGRIADPRPVAVTDHGRLVALIGVTATPAFAELLPSPTDLDADASVAETLVDGAGWLD
jgi:hypothetical protein